MPSLSTVHVVYGCPLICNIFWKSDLNKKGKGLNRNLSLKYIGRILVRRGNSEVTKPIFTVFRTGTSHMKALIFEWCGPKRLVMASYEIFLSIQFGTLQCMSCLSCALLRALLSKFPFYYESVVYILTSYFTKFVRK